MSEYVVIVGSSGEVGCSLLAAIGVRKLRHKSNNNKFLVSDFFVFIMIFSFVVVLYK